MKGGDVTAHRGSVGARAGTKKEEGACVATSTKREWETGRPRNREQCGHGVRGTRKPPNQPGVDNSLYRLS